MATPQPAIPLFPENLRAMGEAYLKLLGKWNGVHSITGLAPEQRFEGLLLDSAALLPHLGSILAGSLVADFGSGMGIPAFLIAAHRPDLNVLAVDRNRKKVAFVRQAALELQLSNLRAECGPIESLAPLNADVGTAKAVGDLGTLLTWWKRHSAPGAPFFAFKGSKWDCSDVGREWSHEAFPYSLPSMGERAIIRLRERCPN
ncbi:MAG: class I SAM-dependent methyltransferase [Holophagales bacterium]|jgi:16S rRNA (guanine527-N7)-methyltransferase|nr:class I SAM-dependent methyltransferase [Holophagales bacterium]